MTRRGVSNLLFAAWLGVVVTSLVVVAVHLGPTALVGASAHESEARSLAATAIYPSHALRELPHLVVLALVWLGAVAPARDGRDFGRQAARLGVAAAAAAFGLFAAAAAEVGARAAWEDLAQFRAARDLVGAGTHWRFHLLSDAVLGGLFYAVGRCVARRDPAAGRPAPPWAAMLAALLFAAALARWGVDDVLSPRYVGHALREVETSAVVALPLLAALALRAPGAAIGPRAASRERGVLLALAVATLAGGLLLRHALGVELMAASSAPSRPVALNLAVHHFEHLFDAAFLVVIDRLEFRRRSRAAAGRPSARD